MMKKDSKIYVAGHNGMVGSAIVRYLKKKEYFNLVLRTSNEVDLTNQRQVSEFFEEENPEFVFLAAAKVGGINANNIYRGEFLYENLMIASNVIHQSFLSGVKKLIFFGSSCIYPKYAEQPISERSLLTGALEQTNEPYAIAKIAGLKLCQTYNDQYAADFISLMPTNLYGPNDNYDLEKSHVLPALLRKFHSAKVNKKSTVEIWGTGDPLREFLHVDDLAEASIFLMNENSALGMYNIGFGKDISIKDLAILIKSIVGFEGKISFDKTKPDGTPRKLMDSSRINTLGWQPKIHLKEGISKVYSSVDKSDW